MKRIFVLIIVILIILFFVLRSVYLNKPPETRKRIRSFLAGILNYILLFTSVTVIYTVVRENNQPITTIAWVQVLVFLPVVGFILYIFFGINYRKKKKFMSKAKEDFKKIDEISQKVNLDYSNTENISQKYQYLEDNKIVRLLKKNKFELTHQNEIITYTAGQNAIDAIYDDIKKAEKTINIEYFSIINDRIGKEFRNILLEAQLKGVQVRLIYDAVGCWTLSSRFFKKLQKAGAIVVPFMPVTLPILSSKLNYRNHRKIIVIDNKLAYLGGVNFGKKYYSLKKKFGFWRDTHLKIKGEAVNSIQKSFLLDWSYLTDEELDYEDFIVKQEIENELPLQIVTSGADSSWQNIMLTYFSLLNLANDYIYISSPYLVLEESMITALKTAALSGIDVRIVLPSFFDHLIVYLGSKSYYEELLSAGVKIYEYEKGFIHSKVILVDDKYTSIGTANMDIRSFKQNFEINAMIYSKEFCQKIREQFEQDFAYSKKVELAKFKDRNFLLKTSESLSRLLSPLL